MTDEQKELKECPFCGIIPEFCEIRGLSREQIKLWHPTSICPLSDSIVCSKNTKEECIQYWKLRKQSPESSGLPIDLDKMYELGRLIEKSHKRWKDICTQSFPTKGEYDHIAFDILNSKFGTPKEKPFPKKIFMLKINKTIAFFYSKSEAQNVSCNATDFYHLSEIDILDADKFKDTPAIPSVNVLTKITHDTLGGTLSYFHCEALAQAIHNLMSQNKDKK